MARRPTRAPLNLFLNSRLVGSLRREASGAVDFRYDPTWLAWEHALPISLSLPLREDRFIGDPVIAVLDNLLPDHETLRRRLAERVKAEGYDPYSLLAAVGRDCVGALQFLPDGEAPGPAGSVSGRPVKDPEIARILNDLEASPLGLAEEGEFRLSLAGAQEKTALLSLKGAWHRPRGTTATTHILKPQIGRIGNGMDLSRSVENEHFCMRLTAALGLATARTEIIDFDRTRALSVERFDRRWTDDNRLLRLPQEDFCQALSVPSTLKYEADGGPGMRAILEQLQASDEPAADRKAFLKAQIVFWLLGATDGHAKNFSIFLLPGGRFRLAPLYDVMSTQPNLDAGEISRNRMKLAMAAGGNRHYVVDSILPRHFVQTATACGVPEATIHEIFEEILGGAADAIDAAQAGLPGDFPTDLATSIVEGMRRRLSRIERDESLRI